jgi:hypothetical protein
LRPIQANSSRDPISKITRAKWTGGVAQAVECMLCKHETLNSSPSPTGKKRKKKEKRKKPLYSSAITLICSSVFSTPSHLFIYFIFKEVLARTYFSIRG